MVHTLTKNKKHSVLHCRKNSLQSAHNSKENAVLNRGEDEGKKGKDGMRELLHTRREGQTQKKAGVPKFKNGGKVALLGDVAFEGAVFLAGVVGERHVAVVVVIGDLRSGACGHAAIKGNGPLVGLPHLKIQ